MSGRAFKVGQLIKHRLYGYRGAVISCDSSCQSSSAWYYSNQTQPSRKQRWYSILVHGSDLLSYVAEENLLADNGREQVVNSLSKQIFQSFKNGSYDSLNEILAQSKLDNNNLKASCDTSAGAPLNIGQAENIEPVGNIKHAVNPVSELKHNGIAQDHHQVLPPSSAPLYTSKIEAIRFTSRLGNSLSKQTPEELVASGLHKALAKCTCLNLHSPTEVDQQRPNLRQSTAEQQNSKMVGHSWRAKLNSKSKPPKQIKTYSSGAWKILWKRRNEGPTKDQAVKSQDSKGKLSET